MISKTQKIGLCLLMGGGLLMVGGVAVAGAQAADVKGNQFGTTVLKEAAGVSTAVTDKAYLILNSAYWGQATSYFTIHYWGGTTSTAWPGNSLTLNSETGAYEGTYDYSSTGATVVRWGNADHTTEWNRFEYSFAKNTVNCFKNTGFSSADRFLVSQTTFDTVFEAPSTYTTTDMHYWDTATGLTTKAWPGTEMTQAPHPYKAISGGAANIWRCSGTFLSSGAVSSGFVFNIPGASPEVKTIDLYGSAYANAFTTSGILSDGPARIEALDFLDYFQVLRVNGSICWVKSDNSAKQTLSANYFGLSSGAKALVDETIDEGDENATVGGTIAMLLG